MEEEYFFFFGWGGRNETLWHTPVNPSPQERRQEDPEFGASPGSITRPCLLNQMVFKVP